MALKVVAPAIVLFCISLIMGELVLAFQAYGLVVGVLCLMFFPGGLFHLESHKLSGLYRRLAMLPANHFVPLFNFISYSKAPSSRPPVSYLVA